MESANLTQDDYKALEATRLRLMQVSSAIGTLKASVLSSNPLPNLCVSLMFCVIYGSL